MASSKKITASAVVTAENKKGKVYALTLNSGTTDSSIILADGGASGTEKWALTLNGTTAAGETSESVSFPGGLTFDTDVYAVLAGTGAEAWVAYEEIATP